MCHHCSPLPPTILKHAWPPLLLLPSPLLPFYPSFFPPQNLGTIRCSNLCTEIIEYTAPDETAVCNLASIALPRFVRERNCEAGYESKKLVGSLDAGSRCVFVCERERGMCVDRGSHQLARTHHTLLFSLRLPPCSSPLSYPLPPFQNLLPPPKVL
jgi:hypothetical protein